ncbi:conserved hypothetical protein [Coccidioides posadasii str. Silveira]|uniref:Uncharacterized protein n=1 Tax=Coccidioides posadasii (strain RMSCC 757 / Silveira) TaxID=443226 RepID=E9DAU7_COCPS|nr:conserved hypothetical protein [Coccidioides posadasii str. Silveira]
MQISQPATPGSSIRWALNNHSNVLGLLYYTYQPAQRGGGWLRGQRLGPQAQCCETPSVTSELGSLSPRGKGDRRIVAAFKSNKIAEHFGC